MNDLLTVTFDSPDLHSQLERPGFDANALDFGVIGFDDAGVVTVYNRAESRLAGLSPKSVLGHGLFTVVAPCMNNFLVAQRFEDAAVSAGILDASIDYVFTLRMKPEKVRLRLLAAPGALRYVLVERRRP